MSTKRKKLPTKRNPIAPALADPIFRPKIVPRKRKDGPTIREFDNDND